MKLLTALLFLFAFSFFTSCPAYTAELVVELSNSKNVSLVGAVERWDEDGNHRMLPEPKAAIDKPRLDATAVMNSEGKWIFKNLVEGKYDLIILTKDKIRIDGFQFVPVMEFDPFIPSDAKIDDDSRTFIIEDIKKSSHYENNVEPLSFAGDKKAIRVLMMLMRDKPTSYEGESPGAATIRHEMWQYTWKYGAWQKEKRTKVFDRLLMPRNELYQWTWLWDSKLGGIELKNQPLCIKYQIPKKGK